RPLPRQDDTPDQRDRRAVGFLPSPSAAALTARELLDERRHVAQAGEQLRVDADDDDDERSQRQRRLEAGGHTDRRAVTVGHGVHPHEPRDADVVPESSTARKMNSLAHVPASGGMPARENMKIVISTVNPGAYSYRPP